MIRTTLALFFSVTLAAHGALAAPNTGTIWTEGAPETGITDETPVTFGAFSKLAKQAAPAVVSIMTRSRVERADPTPFFGLRKFGPTPERLGAGSGVIISADGYIVSNNHVVEGARQITVKLLDGRSFDGEVIGRDVATDIALIRIEADGALPVAPFGDSDRLKIGEWVLAIGNPMGLSHTVTSGIVSAKGRREVQPDRRLRYADFIQTDASINPGNSGGPLFNVKGEVIGINTAINARAQGIGFAIPINMIKQILPQLADDGHVARSWLGVQIQAVTPALAISFGMDHARGALVASVVDRGPAADAGLRAGDVIVDFDGKAIARHDDLPWLASTAGIGKSVDVAVMRQGAEKHLQVRLGELPSSGKIAARHRRSHKSNAKAPEALGLTFGSEAVKAGGVEIRAVKRDSVAGQAGVQPGDVVLRFNGEAVGTAAKLAKAMRAVPQGKLVRLLLRREDGKTFIAFSRR